VDTITGAGMPLVDNHDQFGDLYVEYIVTFPSHVDLDFVKGNNITMLQTKNETNQQSIELKNQVSKPDHDEF
jgi:DnaJ-class molecular chaperone